MDNGQVLKIGDIVLYRGCWGAGKPKIAQVVGLTLTDQPRGKYGDEVQVVKWSAIEANRVCIDLDNHCWAYASQIVRKLTEAEIGPAVGH